MNHLEHNCTELGCYKSVSDIKQIVRPRNQRERRLLIAMVGELREFKVKYPEMDIDDAIAYIAGVSMRPNE